MAQAVDLVVDGAVLFNIGIRGGNVGLRLVVVVVGDKILHGILREKAAHLSTNLACQRFVRLQNQRRAVAPGNDVRHRECFAGTGDAQQRLGFVPFVDALYQRFYRLWLVAGGLEWGFQVKNFVHCLSFQSTTISCIKIIARQIFNVKSFANILCEKAEKMRPAGLAAERLGQVHRLAACKMPPPGRYSGRLPRFSIEQPSSPAMMI